MISFAGDIGMSKLQRPPIVFGSWVLQKIHAPLSDVTKATRPPAWFADRWPEIPPAAAASLRVVAPWQARRPGRYGRERCAEG
jgi:hypothetical protein